MEDVLIDIAAATLVSCAVVAPVAYKIVKDTDAELQRQQLDIDFIQNELSKLKNSVPR